jgi:hypothetical protein
LESAAALQRVVPDAVLVGGSAAALHAGHRDSLDHDHVIADLAERYAEILEAVEATDGWATSVRSSRPPWTLLGQLGGVPAGLRQLRRTQPLETEIVEVTDDLTVVAPTVAEALRVKAFLVVQRGAVRDFLDVVALAEAVGLDEATDVLVDIDAWYSDRSQQWGSVRTQLTLRLADPHPSDPRALQELAAYKGLKARWRQWADVVEACQELSERVGSAS